MWGLKQRLQARSPLKQASLDIAYCNIFPPGCQAGRAGNYAFTNGRLAVGLPVIARMALATAGAITGVPGSPTPVG